jgi:hypothetical protein
MAVSIEPLTEPVAAVLFVPVAEPVLAAPVAPADGDVVGAASVALVDGVDWANATLVASVAMSAVAIICFMIIVLSCLRLKMFGQCREIIFR